MNNQVGCHCLLKTDRLPDEPSTMTQQLYAATVCASDSQSFTGSDMGKACTCCSGDEMTFTLHMTDLRLLHAPDGFK